MTCHSQLHGFQWFYTSSFTPEYRNSFSGVTALLCAPPPSPPTPAQDIYPVGSPEPHYYPHFPMWSSLGWDHCSGPNKTLVFVTSLSVHPAFSLLSMCKTWCKIVTFSLIPQILQIFVEHILSQVLVLVVGGRVGNKTTHFSFPLWSLHSYWGHKH